MSEGLLRDASDGRDAAGEALPLPVDTGAADGGGVGVCTGEYSACGCQCCDSVGKDWNTLGCYYPTAGETLSAIKAANEKRYDPAVCGNPPLCNNVGIRYLCCLPAGPEVPSHVPDHATVLMGGLEIAKSGTDCAQFRFAPSRTSTRLGMRYHIETTAGWALDRAAVGACGEPSAILPASGALGSLRMRASGDHCELDFHATLFFISNAGTIRTVRFDVDRLPVLNMPASQCP